jgi:hypothetical protein
MKRSGARSQGIKAKLADIDRKYLGKAVGIAQPQRQQGGGSLFQALFGDEDSSAADRLKQAMASRKWEAAKFIWDADFVNPSNISNIKDSQQGNIFHLLAGCSDPLVGGFAVFVDAVLCRADKLRMLNQKNRHGMTPLHVAVASGSEELAYLFMDHGADPSIADAKGNRVRNQSSTTSETEIPTILQNLNRAFTRPPADPISTLADPSSAWNPSYGQSVFMVRRQAPVARSAMRSVPATEIGSDSDAYMAQIERYARANLQTGGGRGTIGSRGYHLHVNSITEEQHQSGGADSADEDEFVDDDMQPTDRYDVRDELDDMSLSGFDKRQQGGGRDYSDESKQIHQDVVKEIIKILKIDENDAEDLYRAKAIKAILWMQAKEQAKEQGKSTDIDKANRLKDLATKSTIKAISADKITEMIGTIKQRESERSEREKQREASGKGDRRDRGDRKSRDGGEGRGDRKSRDGGEGRGDRKSRDGGEDRDGKDKEKKERKPRKRVEKSESETSASEY